MFKKKSDYNEVSGYGQSDFKPLPKGGYICRIIKAEETKSSSGKDMLHIAFDIIEGEYTDYFNDVFKARKKANTDPLKTVKWPFEGQKWIMVDDYEHPEKTSRQFKGFCTAVEDSGTEIWNLNGELVTNKLNGAEVGVVFQRVEEEYNGESRWKTLPWAFRSIEAIATGDYFVPDDKPLPQTYGTGFSTADASAINDMFRTAPTYDGSADSFNAAEDDIPF